MAEDERDIRREIKPFDKAGRHGSSCQGSRMSRPGRWWRRWGPDMAPFDTADQLASWACVCPGNHESAGKQRTGKTRKAIPGFGMRLVKPLGEPPKRRSPTSHAQYHRICARRGDQRAILAVAHSMIVTGFYLIKLRLPIQRPGRRFLRPQEPGAPRRAAPSNASVP